jgi:TPR repeat protein
VVKGRYHVIVKAAVLFFLLCLLAVADLAAGLDALKNGDYATALKEFLPLAKQGNADAQNSVGLMYEAGHGVPQDYVEAVRWFRKAAEQGNAKAQFSLAFKYEEGQEVPQNYAEAIRWYSKAAEQGEAHAQFNLGVMYANGQGVPQDYVQGYLWIALGASHSSGEAHRKFAADRDSLAKEMTGQQIAEAQRLAGEWKPKPIATPLEDR